MAHGNGDEERKNETKALRDRAGKRDRICAMENLQNTEFRLPIRMVRVKNTRGNEL